MSTRPSLRRSSTPVLLGVEDPKSKGAPKPKAKGPVVARITLLNPFVIKALRVTKLLGRSLSVEFDGFAIILRAHEW